ncbi:MAG TPA: hypothetical protein VEJ63_20790 [Planctomycetota bacterium]|nr:hypothetical protein [Planctomycetota bacterium]
MADNPDINAVLKLTAKPQALPAPRGKVVRVTNSEEFIRAIKGAENNTTILMADGTYPVPSDTDLTAHGVTIRSESGEREKVIIDGGGEMKRLLRIKGAWDTTIADVTWANCEHYGVFIYGDTGVQRTTIHNCKFHNIMTRAVKGTHPARPLDAGDAPPYPPSVVDKVRPTQGVIRHCLFLNDHAKKHDPWDDGNYISGIDMMGLKDWIISDNVFCGIRGKDGRGRGAIFVWIGCENVTAERNIIINCDRGICFGNPSSTVPNMYSGMVRNNFIVAGANMAVEIVNTVSTSALNNSIFATNFDYSRTLNFSQESIGGRCFNNLVHGKIDLAEKVEHGNNLSGDYAPYFRNPKIGDLRLTSDAIMALGKGKALPDVSEDFDRQPRAPKPCIGAHEPKA